MCLHATDLVTRHPCGMDCMNGRQIDLVHGLIRGAIRGTKDSAMRILLQDGIKCNVPGGILALAHHQLLETPQARRQSQWQWR